MEFVIKIVDKLAINNYTIYNVMGDNELQTNKSGII